MAIPEARIVTFGDHLRHDPRYTGETLGSFGQMSQEVSHSSLSGVTH